MEHFFARCRRGHLLIESHGGSQVGLRVQPTPATSLKQLWPARRPIACVHRRSTEEDLIVAAGCAHLQAFGVKVNIQGQEHT